MDVHRRVYLASEKNYCRIEFVRESFRVESLSGLPVERKIYPARDLRRAAHSASMGLVL
jgi:hypothetical protein